MRYEKVPIYCEPKKQVWVEKVVGIGSEWSWKQCFSYTRLKIRWGISQSRRVHHQSPFSRWSSCFYIHRDYPCVRNTPNRLFTQHSLVQTYSQAQRQSSSLSLLITLRDELSSSGSFTSGLLREGIPVDRRWTSYPFYFLVERRSNHATSHFMPVAPVPCPCLHSRPYR